MGAGLTKELNWAQGVPNPKLGRLLLYGEGGLQRGPERDAYGLASKWLFQQIGAPFWGGLYNKSPTILRSRLGPLILGKLPTRPK